MITRRTGSLTQAPRRLPTLLSAALLSAAVACHGSVRTSASPPPPAAPTLGQSIDAILDNAALSRGSWAVAIRSLDRNDSLYERNAGKMMMPASTLKIVTLATAAERLGWDFSYSTALWRIGTVEDGVLRGDLVVVGSGDPTIDDWDGKATARFAEWSTRLREAGIRKVEGRVIGNDNAFDDVGWGDGWSWDDLSASYAAGVSGLQFNQNSAFLNMTPGDSPGAPAKIEFDPPFSPIKVQNLMTTESSGGILTRLSYDGAAIVVSGRIAPGGQGRHRVSVLNPTMYFARAAREGLRAHGIEISGGAEDLDELTTPVVAGTAVAVADFRSAPLREFGTTMMKLSQNLFAESLLKTIGVWTSRQGTASAGVAATKELMARWGIAEDEVATVDGSGLSRYNLITAGAEATVLAQVYASDTLREPFMQTLPIAGVDGTLARRMVGTAAQGNVRAKSGSFSNARGVAGFVTAADGEHLVFSILANNYNASPLLVDNATDAILVRLAELRR